LPRVIFIDTDGNETEVEADAGKSVMEAAVENNVPGIDADCGGMCACATCHIIVEEEWFTVTGPRNDNEEAMLGFLPDLNERARLGCQIKLSEEMDGLTVRLPIGQF